MIICQIDLVKMADFFAVILDKETFLRELSDTLKHQKTKGEAPKIFLSHGDLVSM